MNILFINGPSLNMLGIREPDIYGCRTYGDLCEFIHSFCHEDHEIFQSNHEGAIVDKIQDALGKYDGIVINAAAYTHTSVAIADALAAVAIPYAEVHLSDIYSRESFRHFSYLSAGALCTITGKGFEGYAEAYERLAEYITTGGIK